MSDMYVNKSCTVMTCALVNSHLLRICSWIELRGKLCSSGEEGKDGKDIPVCTCMCGSTNEGGCVVDGSGAMEAY